MEENRVDAREFLERLVGSPLRTVTGRQNRVLRVEGDKVIVETARSPQGQPVPISEVQAALDRLTRGDEVAVSVSSLGYRSAFIGAALGSVPGAVVVPGRPRRIKLANVERAAQANPPWTLDEEILAFDLYKRVGMADDSHPDVIALSAMLRRLPVHPSSSRSASFRNPNGVARKLADIGTRDPAHPERRKTSGSRLDEEIWERFGSVTHEAQAIAASIRQAAPDDLLPLDDNVERPEGKLSVRLHMHRERDRRLVSAKKREAIEATGYVSCEVCGDAPERVWGVDLTEVHHLTALWAGETTTNLADLAILCPTCHRAAHRIVPWPTISDLRGRRLR